MHQIQEKPNKNIVKTETRYNQVPGGSESEKQDYRQVGTIWVYQPDVGEKQTVCTCTPLPGQEDLGPDIIHFRKLDGSVDTINCKNNSHMRFNLTDFRYSIREMAMEYVEFILGYPDIDIYMAQKGDYGFITDGKQVVSFSCSGMEFKLSGNYISPHGSGCGTGWRMDSPPFADPSSLLERKAPHWAVKNKKITMMTLEMFLERYQPSSKFYKLTHGTSK